MWRFNWCNSTRTESDQDEAVFVIPNIPGFYFSAGLFRVFPAWTLGVDPVKVRFRFEAAGPIIRFDTAIDANSVNVNLAVLV